MGKCYSSITVPAPVEDVWRAVRSFHDLSWAEGVVENVEIVGDLAGDQIGAGRILNGVFHGTLRGLDDLDHSIEYSIDDGPGPVAKGAVHDYVGTLRLFRVTEDDTTFAEWSSTYASADDEASGELCNPVHHASQQALRKMFA